MRNSKFAVFAGILVFAIVLACLANSYAASTPTPNKVIVTPKDPAIVLGGTQQFTAAVYSTRGAIIKNPTIT